MRGHTISADRFAPDPPRPNAHLPTSEQMRILRATRERVCQAVFILRFVLLNRLYHSIYNCDCEF